MEGTLIALEGTDDDVASRQALTLAQQLRTMGYLVELLEFPRSNLPSGYFAKQYQAGLYGSPHKVGPYSASLMYAYDRYDAAPTIRTALAEGKVIIVRHYTTQTMAEFGRTFEKSEERKGFFLWLDSMEYQMMNLPRPTKHIFLNVPITDDKTSTAAVYHDICQLFPKDCWWLETVRNNQPLSEQTLQTLILNKVLPHLPSLPTEDIVSEEELQAVLTSETRSVLSQSSDFSADQPLVLEMSLLMATTLLAYTGISASLSPAYKKQPYFPPGLDKDMKDTYGQHMDRIVELHAKMRAELTQSQSEVDIQVLDAVVPVAQIVSLSLPADMETLEKVIAVLGGMTDDSEALKIRQELTAMIAKVNPGHLTQAKSSKKAHSRHATTAIIPATIHSVSEHIASHYAASQSPKLTLTDVAPRNELDLVADILYARTSLPVLDIKQQISTMPYADKAAILTEYVGVVGIESHDDSVLESVLYSWDIMSDFETFQAFLENGTYHTLQRQMLTPRYGFDVPPAIESLGLLDDYEECFSISLTLHSLLQQAANGTTAQYAMLRGHKLRWKTTFTALQAVTMNRLTATAKVPASQQTLMSEMTTLLAERHPIVTAATQLAGTN